MDRGVSSIGTYPKQIGRYLSEMDRGLLQGAVGPTYRYLSEMDRGV